MSQRTPMTPSGSGRLRARRANQPKRLEAERDRLKEELKRRQTATEDRALPGGRPKPAG